MNFDQKKQTSTELQELLNKAVDLGVCATASDFARKLGKTPPTIYRAIKGQTSSPQLVYEARQLIERYTATPTITGDNNVGRDDNSVNKGSSDASNKLIDVIRKLTETNNKLTETNQKLTNIIERLAK